MSGSAARPCASASGTRDGVSGPPVRASPLAPGRRYSTSGVRDGGNVSYCEIRPDSFGRRSAEPLRCDSELRRCRGAAAVPPAGVSRSCGPAASPVDARRAGAARRRPRRAGSRCRSVGAGRGGLRHRAARRRWRLAAARPRPPGRGSRCTRRQAGRARRFRQSRLGRFARRAIRTPWSAGAPLSAMPGTGRHRRGRRPAQVHVGRTRGGGIMSKSRPTVFDGGADRSPRRRIGQARAAGFDDSVEHDFGRGAGELCRVLRHLIGLVLELRGRIGGRRVDQVLDEDERVQFGSDRRRHQRPAADGADDRSEERRRGGEYRAHRAEREDGERSEDDEDRRAEPGDRAENASSGRWRCRRRT